MDREFILRLIEAVSASEVTKFEHVSAGGERVLIEKGGDSPALAHVPAAASIPAVMQPAPQTDTTSESQQQAAHDESKVVKAPLVGVFYSSPAPDAPAFVKPGQKVKKGDILFIIEAMKVMNEIESEYDGVVLEIKAKSGDLVEYGQPVVIIG